MEITHYLAETLNILVPHHLNFYAEDYRTLFYFSKRKDI